MSDQRRLNWTQVLVIAGIVLGYVSYGTDKLGFGEIYPFADWRLYSAPVGINEEAVTYRVYVYEEESGSWMRQRLEATDAMSLNEQLYALGYWAGQVRADSAGATDADERLGAVGRALAPDADRFRIVAENYYSLPLYRDSTRYDTSTVAAYRR